MISAKDAVAYARSLIGVPYGSGAGQLDCINLIKAVIRQAPGGDPDYRTAGTDELWSSANASGKYRHLIWRQEGLSGVGAGWLVFKGKATDEKDGEPHHVGLATGEGTVIHASSAKGRVVESPLMAAEGWTLAAKHRDVSTENEKGVRPMGSVFQAEVVTHDGKGVNLRKEQTTKSARIGKLPEGIVIDVVDDSNPAWWKVEYQGAVGYVSSTYLHRIEEKDEDEQICGVLIHCENIEEAMRLAELFSGAVVVGGGD